MKVVIDGVEYVPAATVISDKSMQALGTAYAIAYGFGVYDPDDHSMATKHLAEIWTHLRVVNEELHFKE